MKRKLYPGGATTEVRYLDAVLERVDGRDANAEPKYEISISSENEIERNFWGTSWREKLDHSPGSVQMGRFNSGRASFLADHDPTRQLGTLQKARIDPDGKIRAEVLWGVSQTAKERKAEIDAGTGVGTNVSVGYIPKRWKLMEEDSERGDLWLAKLWEPVEASSVAIPADASVGFGRGNGDPGSYPVETEEERSMKMKKVLDERGQVIEVPEDDQRQALNEAQVAVITRATPAAAPPSVMGNGTPKRDRNAEVTEIFELCAANGVTVKTEWLTADLTPNQVAMKILEGKRGNGMAQPGSEAIVPLTQRDASQYSYARAIAIAAGLRGGDDDGFALKPSGIEWEMHREIQKALPNGYRANGGLFVPIRLSDKAPARRTLDSLTSTKGAETVFDRPGDLIELFRNRSVLNRLGARVLTGLTGPIVFPKQTGAMTFYWMPENGGVDVSASDIAFGLVTLAPKTVMGSTKYSRQLLIQAPSGGIDIENMVRTEIGIGHSLEIDRVGLFGTGTGAEPTGLFHAPDVLTGDLGTIDWEHLLDFVAQIAGANAAVDGLGWVTSPEGAAKLMTTEKGTAGFPIFLWEGTILDGTLAGYRAMASNQIDKTLDDSFVTGAGSKHGIAVGSWSEAVLGMWGALEIVVDPYAYKLQGLIEVATFQMMDIIFRHGESFAIDAFSV